MLIILVSFVVRVYKLDSIPPSISWDEAAAGYNAYTIANFGKDEYGKSYPLYFRSFGEGKNPIHIYIGAAFIKLLGLNEFSTRLSAALFGILNVVLIYLLVRLILEKEFLALISALFLAISPFNIHFSHFNHEANFALSFFLLGLIFFYLTIKNKKHLLVISLISFFLSFLSYNGAKIMIPLFLIALFIIYLKQIIIRKKQLVACLLIIGILGLFLYLNPKILGLERYRQTAASSSLLDFKFVLNQYFYHFNPVFLFVSGDDNPKLSPQKGGEFYKIDALLLILGLIFLAKHKSKAGLTLLTWTILAPIPSSLVSESPHAGRAMFMMGSWHIISAAGLYFLLILIKKKTFQLAAVLIVTVILTASSLNFLNYYYNEYGNRYAIEWQYGMKQIVEYLREHPEYEQVYMTEARSQPYIFFLYYLKTPLPEYLNEVYYNNGGNKNSNNVSHFGRYFFGGWDKIESPPQNGILYIVTPSEYDGLKHRDEFEVKKLLKYPNGSGAFFLVSIN